MKLLSRYRSPTASRVAAFSGHADIGFLGTMATLIALWMVGSKLLIG